MIEGVESATPDAATDFAGLGPRLRVDCGNERVEILTDRLGVFVALLVPR